MSIALITLVCILGGALLGLFLGTRLPEHHLSDDSKDTVKLGAGLVATMAALVLGLLVGSAKHSFDAMDNGMINTDAGRLWPGDDGDPRGAAQHADQGHGEYLAGGKDHSGAP